MKKHPFRFILFLLMCVSIPFTATAQDGGLIDSDAELVPMDIIPDQNLRAKIEKQLGKASGDTITTADLAKLTELQAPNANISDLTGLEHATNLTELYLGAVAVEGEGWVNSNSISDLSPLARLTNLTQLKLRGNNISDISALGGLTNLKRLELEDNTITDLSPLASLINLTELKLFGNDISDISPLAGLTNLTWLQLFRNNITDLSPLSGLINLRRLALSGNGITDISPLEELTNLETLGLAYNEISDLSPLEELTNLRRLGLRYNNITDISLLEDLINLDFLDLRGNNISDILPLVNNMGLGSGDTVRLNGNPLSSVSIETHIPDLQDPERGVLVEFDDVEEMELIPDDNLRTAIAEALDKTPEDTITPDDMLRVYNLFAEDISDLTGLELAVNLSGLWVFGGDIEDVSPLERLENLRTLYLNYTNISDLSFLEGLTNLEVLYVSANSIEDISFLEGLTNLESLGLGGNNISDLSPLRGLTNLEVLYASANSIEDISFLEGLTNLESLSLNNNNISDLSPLKRLTKLRFLSLHNNSISFLSPLVENIELRNGDVIELVIELWGNPLNETSIRTHIPKLRDRGVDVDLRTPTTLVKRSGTVTAENTLLIVEVWDKRARTVEGVPVTFTVTSGGGTLSVTSVATDNRGRAESQLTLGPNTGTNTVEVTAEGISESVIFSDVPEPAVRIPDRNLRAAVEKELGKTRVDTITASDMATLRRLRAPHANISDLTGLELATNLTGLFLGDAYADDVSINSNSVSDLSPLEGLTKLRDLRLQSNNISDLSPLAELTNLESLFLNDNAIENISSLAGLTALHDLQLENNNITDISVLAGLTRLRWLHLSGNAISDISVVAGFTNLEWLRLSDNTITDISALAGLINLESLNLDHNNITDLSPLIKNMGLEGDEDYVGVDGNPLSDLSIETHIPELKERGVWVHFVHALSKDARYGHQAGVSSVAFSPDGTMFASGSNDNTVRLWDTVMEMPIATLIGHTATARSVAFSPDGSILASGSYDNTVRLWDALTGDPIATLTGHTGGVEVVAFSPDGNTLASGSHDGTVRSWNPVTRQPIEIVADGLGRVWSVAYSPDGNTLAIGLNNGSILLRDVSAARLPKFLEGHTGFVEGVAFSPDGSTLASGSYDSTVRLWDVATGQPIDTLAGHSEPINSVAFSPDGRTLASASDDSTVILWDAVTGEPIDTLTGHTSFVRSVAFSPDGSTLASGSGDGAVRLWNTPSTISEYTLSIPADISLIHVPLKVATIDGIEKTIESVGDLYDALGGADTVTSLVTLDSQAQKWHSYVGTSSTGTPADKELTDDMGIIAIMKTPVSVYLTGAALGTNGTSSITLNPGHNLVGLPLRDERIDRVSDLLRLDGIWGNVSVITLNDGGKFKTVRQAGDPGDIEITGGQAFILLDARQTATVEISGEAWTNVSEIAAAPPVAFQGIKVGAATPVLGLSGSVVGEAAGLKGEGFRVTVKNLSTGRAVTDLTKDDDRVGYQLTVVDIETMRAATVGDILEISAQSPHPFIGVEPLRYTVTAEDVKRSQIQLPQLVVYEIPTETELLRNYPNPFNPETWIPYRLAEDADIKLTIYDSKGRVVRSLDIGHQVAAVYESRSKAIYWDGRNAVGEAVASGLYFYHLSAGNYSATRRMVILK